MDDFEEIKGNEGTLEQTEDATYRTGKDFFGREKVLTYPYSSAEDFKTLTPDKILTRRLKLIKPDIETGQLTKRVLSERQRQALQRLMAIKKNVEVFPKEKQDKVRADMLAQYEQNADKIELLIDQMILEIKVEDINKKFSDAEDKRLQKRLEELRGYISSEEELIERFKKLKGPILSETELRERLRLLKKNGGAKKTRKARRAGRAKNGKKSQKSNKSKKSSKSKKSTKAKKGKKSRRMVKN
jgi:hypothetical protein